MVLNFCNSCRIFADFFAIFLRVPCSIVAFKFIIFYVNFIHDFLFFYYSIYLWAMIYYLKKQVLDEIHTDFSAFRH